MGTAKAIAAQFPGGRYKTFIDVGCAQGGLPVQVALAHAHLTGGGYDLPVECRRMLIPGIAACRMPAA